MSVKITAYRVRPASDAIDVELSISLPTGSICATIVATEATLNGIATQSGRSAWDERDLVTVVSGVFLQLSSSVAVAS